MKGFANMTCVAPNWPVSSNVTVFTTTRLGGVSQPPFDSMNLGLHVGDDEAAVIENRRRLQHSFGLPSEPVWLNQTHGTDICDITPECAETNQGDGACTKHPDTVLAVLTADCLPVVISDEEGTQLALVHAGWRGLANGILNNAMQRFNAEKTIHAWLGPAIGPQRFEVGEDVLDAFMQNRKRNAEHFKPTNRHGKYMADLYALATSELMRAGCTSVSGGDYCTCSDARLFHSHRRDGKDSGRMATIAWMSPGN